ncbi:MAG: transposase [Hyphomonas sp.]|nr:transposase [Hyphomonas sp.]MCC0017597.1 transposase [Rhodobiaceae bacterium]
MRAGCEAGGGTSVLDRRRTADKSADRAGLGLQIFRHLLLYRQVKIYARSGIQLDRSTLARWGGTTAYRISPLVARVSESFKASGYLCMDETKCPVLDSGCVTTKSGHLWALARGDRPGRSGGARHLLGKCAPQTSGNQAVLELDHCR